MRQKNVQLLATHASEKSRTRPNGNYQLYLMVLPVLVYIGIFHYLPMYGVLMSFQDFFPPLGILGSPWVGLRHFVDFFQSSTFIRVTGNTLLLSLYALAVGFPFPILLAIALHYAPYRRMKRVVQTTIYAPHFISTVVLVGMINVFLSPNTGIVSRLLTPASSGMQTNFLADPTWFRTLYVWSGVWQHAGWDSIIYLAALSSINPLLHEAAKIDGASLIRRIWHVDLPGIAPTVIVLLILSLGRMMSIGFEKVYLMQNSLNVSTSEVIATFVYKRGLLGSDYSFSAAVGLFNSTINAVLLIGVNRLSKKVAGDSLW